jgi:hypothetical protein
LVAATKDDRPNRLVPPFAAFRPRLGDIWIIPLAVKERGADFLEIARNHRCDKQIGSILQGAADRRCET